MTTGRRATVSLPLYLRLWAGHQVGAVQDRWSGRARASGSLLLRTAAVLRPGWRLFSGSAAELRMAAALASAHGAAAVHRLRPVPLGDRGMVVAMSVAALTGLAAAALIGVALAGWWAPGATDELPAAAGAVTVGAAILTLLVLVFGEKRTERTASGRSG